LTPRDELQLLAHMWHVLREVVIVTKAHQEVLEDMAGIPPRQTAAKARDTERLQRVQRGVDELEAMFRDLGEPPPEGEQH
jgi:hypothetical protein